MIRWIARGLLACTSLFAVSVYATEETYQLQLQVERNDIVVAETNAEINSGGEADFRIAEDNGVALIRIVALVQPLDATGKEMAVDLQYFEKQRGHWLLIAAPSVVATQGEHGSVEFSSDSSHDGIRPDRYKVSFTVVTDG